MTVFTPHTDTPDVSLFPDDGHDGLHGSLDVQQTHQLLDGKGPPAQLLLRLRVRVLLHGGGGLLRGSLLRVGFLVALLSALVIAGLSTLGLDFLPLALPPLALALTLGFGLKYAMSLSK